MKKQLFGTITAVFLLAIVVSGATYAFFRTTITPTNNTNVNTSIMNIVYQGGEEITGPMQMVASRNEGFSTEINVHTTDESVRPTISLFINIDRITANIAVEGLIWEVCAERSGDQTVCKTGNFLNYNDTNNNKLYIYPDYQLNNTNTKFTVYIWLDGSKVDNSVSGGEFSGYIGAESEHFTAKFT